MTVGPQSPAQTPMTPGSGPINTTSIPGYYPTGYTTQYMTGPVSTVTQPVGTYTQRETVMVPRQVTRMEAVPVQQQVVTQAPPVPTTAKLTGSVTIPKQSVVMESHGVEQKVPKYEYDVRTVNCPKTVEVEKQIMETKLVAIQVPKIIKQPQTVMEERYIKIPKLVYEKKVHTRKVPRMVYDDEQYETTEQVFETRIHTVQQPRTVTTYETVPVESYVPTSQVAVMGPAVQEQVVQNQTVTTQPVTTTVQQPVIQQPYVTTGAAYVTQPYGSWTTGVPTTQPTQATGSMPGYPTGNTR